MSDLAGKFGVLEAQLQAQHGQNTLALNAILTALGAPPPAPGATLADVLGALNQIALMLAGLCTDMAAQHAAQLAQLQQLNTIANLQNENASLNAQRLLLGLAALDPCKSCDPLPLELPPVDATERPIDQEHCKRMQALIYILKRFLVKLDLVSTLGAGFSITIIRDALQEVYTEVANPILLQLPTTTELLQLVAALVGFVASNVFSGASLVESYTLQIEDSLLPALYATNSAAAGYAVYGSLVDSSTLPAAVKTVLKAAGYRELFNDMYDRAKQYNLTGYDGTICAPAELPCVTYTSSAITTSFPGDSSFQNVPRQAVIWNLPEALDHDQSGFVYSATVIRPGDFAGWQVTAIAGAFRVVQYTAGSVFNTWLTAGTDAQYTIPAGVIALYFDDYLRGGAFSAELCKPIV